MDQAKTQAIELRAALQKCTDDEDALEILKQLAEVKMDMEILSSTALGLLVNKHRKSENAELSTLAKNLVSAWKRIAISTKSPLPRTDSNNSISLPRTGSNNNVNSASAKATSNKKASKTSPTAPAPTISSATASNSAAATSSESEGANILVKSDIPEPKPGDFRYVVQEKLCGILEAANDINKKKIAVQIEEHMFVRNGRDSGQSYREQSRSILFNLRDAKNPELKRELLDGSLTPYDLVRRSPEELASAEQRKRVREAFEKAVARARTDWEDTQEETEASWCDMFQCPQCSERKTKFKQKQIRSADEPMTTFILCGVCRFRWTDN